MKNVNLDILHGNTVPVFFYYTLPWVLGMVALSSAGIVDGIFLGNYVGAKALASVTLAMPIMALLFGIGIMLSVGGSVMCGKYIGEGNQKAAAAIFTKTIVTVFVFCLLVAVVGIGFKDLVLAVLGANEELAGPTGAYLVVIFIFSVFFVGDTCLSFFVRLDGRPVFASGVMISSAVFNIILDWLFIVHLDMGIKGAALATGIAHTAGFILLGSHFFSNGSRLKLTRQMGSWREVGMAAYNGVSEFASEMSGGIVTLIFNRIMIARLGVDGVAAFTIIHYILFLGLMFSYGIADSLQPLVSTNFGARKAKRIKSFVTIASGSVVTIGFILIGLLLTAPEFLIDFFLKDGETRALEIAMEFSTVFWPAFIFNGINIVISSYLTSMQKPLPSAVVSLSRSLILPVCLLAVLPNFMGDTGIYAAIPIAELVTFFIAFAFLSANRPVKLTGAEKV